MNDVRRKTLRVIFANEWGNWNELVGRRKVTEDAHRWD